MYNVFVEHAHAMFQFIFIFHSNLIELGADCMV